MSIYKNKKKIHIRHRKNTTELRIGLAKNPRYKNIEHNVIIVGEDNVKYDFLTLTTKAKRDSRHKNIQLRKNPKPGDNRNSYYENKLRKDYKKNFHFEPSNTWRLSKEDFEELIKFLETRKK